MPTYQYACTACDERLEVVQKFSDDPLTECGTCGGRLRKVFSAAGIIFKGSGFYRTDSRGSGKSPATTSADGSEKEKPEKKAESTVSESKSPDRSDKTTGKADKAGSSSTTASSSSSSSDSEKVA